jgi:hypothetical protein
MLQYSINIGIIFDKKRDLTINLSNSYKYFYFGEVSNFRDALSGDGTSTLFYRLTKGYSNCYPINIEKIQFPWYYVHRF